MATLAIKAIYYASAGVAFFTIVHCVAILGWHYWQRTFLGMPIGIILGLFEIGYFTFLGLVSFAKAGKNFKEMREQPKKIETRFF